MSFTEKREKHKQFLRGLLGDDQQSRREQSYMPASTAATQASAARFAVLLSIITGIFFVLFLLWASVVHIDEVTRGQGQVIPSSSVQVIQNLEGGILREILIKEGEVVEAQQVLLRIDNVLAQSTLKEMQKRLQALNAKAARLEAIAEGKASIEFPEDIPDSIKAQERAEFLSRQRQQSAANQVLEAQVRQRRREVGEFQSTLRGLQSSLAIAQETEQLNAKLFEEGVVSRVDYLQSQSRATELRSEIATTRVSISRANAGLQEAQERVNEAESSLKADASAELSIVQPEIASLLETMQTGEDRVNRTEVRAPVKSSVKDIKVNTIGGVIKAGEDIVELVPVDDALVVEARVRPADIAFISIGQSARIKITAYDYSIYGDLPAKVKNISTDTLEDDKGNYYYQVKLQTDKSAIEYKNKTLAIIPGMTATAEILTGRKSVLHYLLKPILKVRDNAFTER